MSRFVRNLTESWAEADPDRRNSILLVAGISLVVVVALLIIAIGYYSERIAGGSDTVLTVGGREFNYGYFERRVLSERSALGASFDSNRFSQIVGRVLGDLEREELLRREAEESGMKVTAEDVEAKMREKLNLPEDVERDVFASTLAQELKELDLSLGEYKDIARAELIEERLREQFRSTIPAETEHLDLRLLQVATQAEALDAKRRLDEGEELALLAGTLSIHPSRSAAGELNWVPKGSLPIALEDVLYAQEVGTISDIIELEQGFFIVEVRGKEVRPVDDEGRDRIVEQRLSALLLEIRNHVGSEVSLAEDQVATLARTVQAAVIADSDG